MLSDAKKPASTFAPLNVNPGTGTGLTALKPTTLLSMFNEPLREGVAEEVEATIIKMIKGATV